MLKNETSEIFFAKSAKEEGASSENGGKNPQSQTRCICGRPQRTMENVTERNLFECIIIFIC